MQNLFRNQNLVRVEKVSGLDFLLRAEDAWSANDILVIGENSGSGIRAHREFLADARSGWWEAPFELDEGDLIAQISSSSGTTGEPKAIAISRRAVSNTVRRLVEAMEIDCSIREYVAVPVTFSFGLGRVRAVGAVGGASYIPPMFRPDEIGDMLRRGDINSLSAVPTMLRVILSNPKSIEGAGDLLRWLEIGSQYMTGDEKRQVREMFPNAVILQHYGLTEASRSTFLRVDMATDSELASVGRPGGEIEVRTDASGRIGIKGPHLAEGIVSNGEMIPITDADGWLNTTDVGELRDGNLFFQGRLDDVVNIGGVKVSAEHFERQVSCSLSTNVPIAACRISDKIRGEKLGVFCEAGAAESIRSSVKIAAAKMGLQAADFSIFEVPRIPRTETGKIVRHKLLDMFESAAVSTPLMHRTPVSSVPSSSIQSICLVLEEVLGVNPVKPEDTFYDLGGDSLSAVGVLLRFEQMDLPPSAVQRLFDGASVAQIAEAIDNAGGELERRRSVPALCIDALNAVRGLFALLIVVSHWGPFFVERMGPVGSIVWSLFSPALRIGTPGFAMIYGMGLGLVFFGQSSNREAHVRRRLRKNSAILIAGVLVTAVAISAQLHFTGVGFGAVWPEQVFYTVLLFYAMIVPASLILLKTVRRANNQVFASLLLSLGAYATYFVLISIWPVNSFSGWGSLAWHIGVAPYAFPRLLGAVTLGLSVALWMKEQEDDALIGAVTRLGFLVFAFGVLLLLMLPGGFAANAGHVWAVMPFAGATLLIYSAAITLIEGQRAILIFRLAIVCGILAFPIFVTHGLVIPVYHALQGVGLGPSAALGIPLGIFLLSILFFGYRVYVLRFGVQGSKL